MIDQLPHGLLSLPYIRLQVADVAFEVKAVNEDQEAVFGVQGGVYEASGRVYVIVRHEGFRCVEMVSGERLWESSKPMLNANGSGRGSWPSAITIHHEPSNCTIETGL
jgi:hypothetical protein